MKFHQFRNKFAAHNNSQKADNADMKFTIIINSKPQEVKLNIVGYDGEKNEWKVEFGE